MSTDSWTSDITKIEAGGEVESDVPAGPLDGGEEERPTLSKRTKALLLLTFSIAQFLDITCRSGVLVFVEHISVDLGIKYQASTWILTSFSVPFAAFLLFWGRVADLFSPKDTFVYAFYVMGALNLVISFMTNQYAYFVLRAASGMAASATIPAAIRLIMSIYEPHEVPGAIAVFTLAAALANAMGLTVGGFFGFIKVDNQLAGWRWFFRFVTLVGVPFAAVAQSLVPRIRPPRASQSQKWRQFDLPGALIMLAANLLLILGLTLGASYGWKTAKFIAPFALSWPLFGLFFLWERRLPERAALIPSSTWRVRNMVVLLFMGIGVFGWFGGVQLPLIERFESYYHESPIQAAVRLLPLGVAAFVPLLFLPKLFPVLRPHVRWFLAGTQLLPATALLLLIYSKGEIHGGAYWRWDFPAFIVGSFFQSMAFVAINVMVVTSVPPGMTGVASAIVQVSFQIGSVVSMSVQAGLLTIYPGSLANWANVQASFWFMFGWGLLNALLAAAFLKSPGSRAEKTQTHTAGAAPADVQADANVSELESTSPGARGVEPRAALSV